MILAIDPGRTTGWAASDRRCGSFRTPVGDDGEALHVWESQLLDLIIEARPTTLAIERAFFGRAFDADWPTALIRTAHKVAFQHDIRRVELAALSVRKRIFGSGRVTDRQRIKGMRARGWTLNSDHEADAAALLVAVQEIQAEQRGARERMLT